MSNFTGFEVAFRSISTAVAAKMEISSLFTAEGGASGSALLFDAILHDDYYERVDLDSGISYIKRKGTGLRIALKASNLDTKQAVTFSSVAAQASLGTASVEYRVHGIGLSLQVVESLLDIPVTEKLSADTYQALRTAIQQRLPEYLRSNVVGTGDYTVPLPPREEEPIRQARAVNYAVSMIARRTPLAQALQHKPAELAQEVVAAIYARLVPTSADAITPEQADRASRWLVSGAIS